MIREASTTTALRERLAAERELTVLRSGFQLSRRRLRQIARSGRPIVAGPFVSEVGFESLYWIPLLRWLKTHYGVDPERVTAFSRGGPASWYEGVASGYLEVFDHLSPADLKERQARRVATTRNEKQLSMGELERELLAAAGLGDDVEVLDPSLMYRLFWAVWALRRPIRRVVEHTEFRPLERPPGVASSRARELMASLPRDYVAVKPYFSDCLPDTSTNRRFLSQLLTRLAETNEVVLLSTGIDLDEHSDYSETAKRITDISPFVEPRDNLEVQSDIVRGARALYTTYGGFAHLGPFLGARTLAFYSDESFNPVHLDVMTRAVMQLRTETHAGFALLHVSDLPLLDPLTGNPRKGVHA